MVFRDALRRQSMRLLQDPRVVGVLKDRRVMNGVMQVMRLRGRIQESFDERVERLAKRLNLATKSELRELRRSLRQMERALAENRVRAERARDGVA